MVHTYFQAFTTRYYRVNSRLRCKTLLDRFMTLTFRGESVAFMLAIKEMLAFYILLSFQLAPNLWTGENIMWN
jgi:hypothetical protein